MSFRAVLYIVFAYLSVFTTTFAQQITQAEIDRTFAQNILNHYVTCASYYATLSRSDRFKEAEVDEMYNVRVAQRQSLHLSLVTMKYLNAEDKSDEALKKVLEEINIDMSRLAGPNYDDYHKLVELHDQRCQLSIQDPSQFIRVKQQELIQQYVALD